MNLHQNNAQMLEYQIVFSGKYHKATIHKHITFDSSAVKQLFLTNTSNICLSQNNLMLKAL